MKDLVPLAKSLSQHSHAGQKYGNQDYFLFHVEPVVKSLQLQGFSDSYIIVAYLHDVVEDTSVTIETIYNLFGPVIGDAVKAITKIKGVDRADYLAICAKNKIARVVKFHDAVCNGSNCILHKDSARFNYYIDTISQLKV